MAHALRAVTNKFVRKGIDLDVRVIADMADSIQLMEPRKGATSILLSRFRKGLADGERDRVHALIFIHKFANRHLARVCIAHEVYHLLLELQAYVEGGRRTWPHLPASKQIEDDCNLFAWQLCKFHDDFHRSETARQRFVYFPERMFDRVLKLNVGAYLEWPAGIALDPRNPFHAPPPIPR